MSENNEKMSPETTVEKTKSERKKIRIRDVIAYILCVAISFVIWVYVVKLESETEEYTFTQVAVQLDGVKEMKDKYNLSIISGYNNEINVTVTGTKKDITKYKSEDIIAHVDLSGIKTPDRHSLEISVDLPAGLTLVSSEPSKINVFVDETVTREVKLKVNLLYNVATDITIHDPKPTVNKVSVTGPKTLLETISKAVATYDMGTVTTSMNFIAPIKLYDLDDSEISNPYIKMDITEVKVNVPVTMRKTVDFSAKFAVDDGDKFDYKVEFAPKSVTIEGDPKIIADINEAQFDLKNITNAHKGKVSIYEDIINFRSGVKILNDDRIEIEYNVIKTPKK